MCTLDVFQSGTCRDKELIRVLEQGWPQVPRNIKSFGAQNINSSVSVLHFLCLIFISLSGEDIFLARGLDIVRKQPAFKA